MNLTVFEKLVSSLLSCHFVTYLGLHTCQS